MLKLNKKKVHKEKNCLQSQRKILKKKLSLLKLMIINLLIKINSNYYKMIKR